MQRILARIIAEDGPIVMNDLIGDDDHIVLAHTGDDPASNWTLHLAHPADRPASCTIEVVKQTQTFTDCDGRTLTVDDLAEVPAGVFPVYNKDEGTLTLDLTPTPSSTTAAPPPLPPELKFGGSVGRAWNDAPSWPCWRCRPSRSCSPPAATTTRPPRRDAAQPEESGRPGDHRGRPRGCGAARERVRSRPVRAVGRCRPRRQPGVLAGQHRHRVDHGLGRREGPHARRDGRRAAHHRRHRHPPVDERPRRSPRRGEQVRGPHRSGRRRADRAGEHRQLVVGSARPRRSNLRSWTCSPPSTGPAWRPSTTHRPRRRTGRHQRLGQRRHRAAHPRTAGRRRRSRPRRC